MATKQEHKQDQKQETETSLSLMIGVACDITLITGLAPQFDEENENHLMWMGPDDDFPQVLVCNASRIITVSGELLREEFLALIGVSAMHDYKFATMEIEDDEDHPQTFNPFQQNHKPH
jgi:hypothetical protein